MSRVPPHIADRLRLPLIAAPMFRVSGPDLVVAACNGGVIGGLPTKNARTGEELRAWLAEIRSRLTPGAAPFAPNLIMRDARRDEDLAAVIEAGAEMVITSVGSPAPVMAPLREAGCLVLCDVATLDHARKAVAAGADGLILLTAGAGGHTGWMNPMAFARAVRGFYDGIVVLAGGIIDGVALAAAELLGCDLGYMGTRFIAARESLADEAYRAMLAEGDMDDVVLTDRFRGMQGNYLAASVRAAGLDPRRLSDLPPMSLDAKSPWSHIHMGGHTISGVRGETTVAALIEEVAAEYAAAGGRWNA